MDSEPDSKEIKRKKLTIFVIVLMIVIAIALPVAGYFLSPTWQKPTLSQTVIGRISDLPLNQPQFVTYEERRRDGWYVSTVSKGVWLVTKDGKTAIGFDPHCTHLNCPYYWDNNRNCFLCPCHGGVFDVNGNVLAGPPPRPLDRLEIFIQDGNIITTDRIIKQG